MQERAKTIFDNLPPKKCKPSSFLHWLYIVFNNVEVSHCLIVLVNITSIQSVPVILGEIRIFVKSLSKKSIVPFHPNYSLLYVTVDSFSN